MNYFFGILFLVTGVFHGVHVLDIEPGSITNLNNTSFLSFNSLDRLASAGLVGKLVVLLIDIAITFLGIRELLSKKRNTK